MTDLSFSPIKSIPGNFIMVIASPALQQMFEPVTWQTLAKKYLKVIWLRQSLLKSLFWCP